MNYLPQRKSIRLPQYNYAQPGMYFVTICTYEMRYFFGNIVNDQMILSKPGNIIRQIWTEIPNKFNHANLDEFVIMPNHIHGIITLDRRDAIYGVRADRRVRADQDNAEAINRVRTGGVTGTDNPMGTGSLGEIIRWFKGRSNHEMRHNADATVDNADATVDNADATVDNADAINGVPTTIGILWQSRFYDHIIRDEDDLNRIRQYIKNNPQKWHNDEFFRT